MQPVWKRRIGTIIQRLLCVLQLCYFAECTRTDLRTGYISVGLSLICAVCGVILRIMNLFAGGKFTGETMIPVLLGIIMDAAIGIFAMAFSFFSLNAFGMGDAWMVLVMGILSGRERGMLILWLAFMVGGIYGSFCMGTGKKNRTDAFPFAPCLLTAYMICSFL